MHSVKELTQQEMKKISGGNNCTNGTIGGAIAGAPGGALGILAGAAGGAVAGGCINFGYNKNPKHGWN
ncbi:bacteriocin-type signal sequence-containing protein [Enterococcus malodoratus]|uniref:Blp family class II bacteriocin n=1 Tax=Enterococcus malodoratus TaxID=71451 RepID=UPI0008C5E5B3|nr:Blp family class II bacteriocin [Enterococcus malodoratus]SEU02938.1 bacteriocin-type signal sequence-containing protein [Enterococcus malodoratus]